MTCVSQKNLYEIPQILDRLADMKCKPRKAMFLPVLGNLGTGALNLIHYKEMIEQCAKLNLPFKTNFAETTESLLKEEHLREIPCYVGRVSFHIKANGDFYPCCLVGGEAISTQTDMRFGNVYEFSLEQIRKRNMRLPLHYFNFDSSCRNICQWKQMTLNSEAHKIVNCKISIP